MYIFLIAIITERDRKLCLVRKKREVVTVVSVLGSSHRSGKPSRQKPASQHVFAVIEGRGRKPLSQSPLLNFSSVLTTHLGLQTLDT